MIQQTLKIQKKAVGLISGGLDSTIAAKIIHDLGFDVYGIYFAMPWGCCNKTHAMNAAKKTGIKLSEPGATARVEWMVEEAHGVKLRQKNVRSNLARDGTCVDVHLSKVAYRPDDVQLFSDILKTVRLTDLRDSRVSP